MPGSIPFISQSSPAVQAEWLAALRSAMPAERVLPFAALTEAEREEAHFAIVANPDPAEVRQLPNLLWIQSLWAGVERLVLDLHDCDATIVRLVDPELARTMAEAVLAWTLYLHRDMPAYAAAQRRKRWLPLDYVRPADRTVSLLGLGELGRAAAARLNEAGFRVKGWSRSQRSVAGVETFSGQAGLLRMLAGTDILVCLLPLTPDTRGLIGGSVLASLPKGASLINFGRGAVLETEALLAALDAGEIGHAVLDVFESEPLAEESPFWAHGSVTVLPHISAETNRQTASAIAAANVKAYRETRAIPRGIDRALGY